MGRSRFGQEGARQTGTTTGRKQATSKTRPTSERRSKCAEIQRKNPPKIRTNAYGVPKRRFCSPEVSHPATLSTGKSYVLVGRDLLPGCKSRPSFDQRRRDFTRLAPVALG